MHMRPGRAQMMRCRRSSRSCWWSAGTRAAPRRGAPRTSCRPPRCALSPALSRGLGCSIAARPRGPSCGRRQQSLTYESQKLMSHCKEYRIRMI